jgi:hypothetical protein
VTQFLGAAAPSLGWLEPDDIRTRSEHWRQHLGLTEWRFTGAVGDQRTPWWPGASGQGFFGDAGADVSCQGAFWHGEPDTSRGSAYRWVVQGYARDQYGSPLSGAAVKLYRTSTDEMVMATVSGSDGSYLLTSPYYPDPHYLVMYKSGTPDVFGTSLNTLVGV